MQNYGTTEGESSGAKEALQDQAGQVADKAREVGGTVQDRMREQVDSRSTQAGEQVASVSEAMRGMGDQLRSQGNDLPAQLAHQAAQRADQLAGYLREADANRIIADVEDFGRRQPWVVVAAGLVLGVAAARFVKASSRRRSESGGSAGSYATGYQPSAGYGSATYGSGAYGSTGYGTPAVDDTSIAGSYPSEPVEVTTRVNEREGGTYPLEGRE